ncbi:hypothetical protein [Pseudoalteromonas lipolytica]|uniref:hypothetical protein n=1 Tax=Pseudoalteromonas lipolytica TaxID=570156 RepID=UPI003A987C17
MNLEIKKLLECLIEEGYYSSIDAKLTSYTTAVGLLLRNQQLFDYEPKIAYRGFPLEESEEEITFFSKKCLLIIDKLHGAASGGSRYIYRSKGVRVYLFEDGHVLTVTPYSTIDDDGFQLQNDPWYEGYGYIPRTIEGVEDIIDHLNEPNEFTQRVVSEEMINILCNVKEKHKRSYCLEYVLTPLDVNNLSSFSKKFREGLWDVIFSVDDWSEDKLNLCIDYLLRNEINPLPSQLLTYISKISKSVITVQQMEELLLNLEQKLNNKIEDTLNIDNLFNYFSQKNLESPPYRLLNTTESLKSVVNEILTEFKDLVENKGLWKQFWISDSKPRNEHSAQEIFCSIAHSFCKANNIDLSPEANFGNGPVDFKLSSGYHSKVVVEMKLSTNSRIVHGYETQLEVYKSAESTKYGILLIIDVGGIGNKHEKILQLKQEYPLSEVWYVDANRKASASKRI